MSGGRNSRSEDSGEERIAGKRRERERGKGRASGGGGRGGEDRGDSEGKGQNGDVKYLI